MLQPPAADTPAATRHDGWDGARKRWFLEEFADHGVATRALERVGKGLSGLYALRARDAVFAAAWDAARLLARERLFDTLIGQAFEGEEHVTIREGGETRRCRRNYRLGMGMLDRLNAFRPSALAQVFAGHFQTVCAMIGDDADAIMWRDWFDGIDHKIWPSTLSDLFPLPEELAENQREFEVWDYNPGEPRTNMPPPPGFDGVECGSFEDDDYERAMTEDEVLLHYARVSEDGLPPVPEDVAKRERGLSAWVEYFGKDVPAHAESDDLPIEVKSMHDSLRILTTRSALLRRPRPGVSRRYRLRPKPVATPAFALDNLGRDRALGPGRVVAGRKTGAKRTGVSEFSGTIAIVRR